MIKHSEVLANKKVVDVSQPRQELIAFTYPICPATASLWNSNVLGNWSVLVQA